MTESRLKYLGPVPNVTEGAPRKALRDRLPWAFIVVVLTPTLLAAIYFLFLASPRYVSEARFLVRSPERNAPSAFGVALQGVGLSSGQADAFAVHEYLTSADGIQFLQSKFNLDVLLNRPGADVFSRYPRPFEAKSAEALQKGLKRFVTIGYDSTTGISTLRVEAFRPQDAQALSIAMLEGGEKLVNRLNERAASDTVEDARVGQQLAQQRFEAAQAALTNFRNREELIEPKISATESTELISALTISIAQLKAERAQVAAETPQSPVLSSLNNKIAAYESLVAAERRKISGDPDSLAPRVGAYEELIFERELASKEVASATAAFISAEQEARRQKLYLERIVAPSLPETPAEPRRWLSILIVFASALLVYGLGWLVWAGINEHKQD